MRPEYPKVCDAADQASGRAQRDFMLLTQIQLALLTATAFLSGAAPTSEHRQHVLDWCICTSMFMSLAVSLALRLGSFAERWFKCRAYAENLKSIVWYFVMSAGSECQSQEEIFLAEFASLQERLPRLKREFAAVTNGNLITPWMLETQSLPIAEKIDIYKTLRLRDQITWYAYNSQKNSVLDTRYFWTVFTAQFFGVAYAAFQAIHLLRFNLLGGVAALSAALLAWSQTKRFSDLSTSYAIAASDLQLIAARHRVIEGIAGAERLLVDVETAVSREHSMWLARRIEPC